MSWEALRDDRDSWQRNVQQFVAELAKLPGPFRKPFIRGAHWVSPYVKGAASLELTPAELVELDAKGITALSQGELADWNVDDA